MIVALPGLAPNGKVIYIDFDGLSISDSTPGPILVTHGEMDYRVPVDQGMAAFNAARMMGVEAKLLLFPEENHWILKPQNSVHWNREFFAWLDKYCKE